jgi:hypothetical protein
MVQHLDRYLLVTQPPRKDTPKAAGANQHTCSSHGSSSSHSGGGSS